MFDISEQGDLDEKCFDLFTFNKDYYELKQRLIKGLQGINGNNACNLFPI